MKRLMYVFVALATVACHGHDPIPKPVPADKVLLMYDNIDSEWFSADLEEAGLAVAQGALDADERVLFYQRLSTGNIIGEIVRDKTASKGFTKKVIKQYASTEDMSLGVATLTRVVGDIRGEVPADHYGLAFGSHGLGWLPKSVASNLFPTRRVGSVASTGNVGAGDGAGENPFAEVLAPRENPLTRFFASEGGRNRLDVSEFVAALEAWKWDFVILDDCFMSSVEVLYEMRNLTTTVIASPTEIMGLGFPYGRVITTVFADWSDMIGVGRDFIDYYKNLNSSRFPSCGTIAVVKMDQMGALAESIRRLGLHFDELTSTAGIQYYEGYSRPGHLFFDLDAYLGAVRGATMPAEYNAFKAQLARTVLYAGYTDQFYSDYPSGRGTYIPVTHFSGLSVFIPWSETAAYGDMYRQTGWYKEVYAK